MEHGGVWVSRASRRSGAIGSPQLAAWRSRRPPSRQAARRGTFARGTKRSASASMTDREPPAPLPWIAGSR
eukprot:9726083-Heterocapsa_arctica.AAC.1